MSTTYNYDNADNRTSVSSGTPITIQLGSGASENLRTIANANGYSGSNTANYTFVVGAGVIVTGSPNGGIGVDTGTWPSGVTLALQVSGTVRGGGGHGGNGGTANGLTAVAGGAGTAGGDAILCHANITITVNSSGLVQSGGGGGGGGGANLYGGGGTTQAIVPGGGGGGGAPNGSGGVGGTGYNEPNGTAGSSGTTSGGGAGGSTTIPGGAGGTYATVGSAGSTSSSFAGGSGAAAGYAVHKLTSCTVTNNGTITGTVG